MPRTPRDAHSVIALRPHVEVVKRITPPPSCRFNQDELTEFNRMVNSLPADWFSEANVMTLVEYCRHVVMAKNLSVIINDLARRKGSYDKENFKDLVRMHNAKTKLISQLMTNMRLTQQSIIDKTVGKHSKEIDMPWQFGDDESDDSSA